MIYLLSIVTALILFHFYQKNSEIKNRQIDLYGGIKNKYKTLINSLSNHPNANIIKESNSHVHIRMRANFTATNFVINSYVDTIEIEWIGEFASLGTHKKKWTFAQNYPQENMLNEINSFIEWKSNQLI